MYLIHLLSHPIPSNKWVETLISVLMEVNRPMFVSLHSLTPVDLKSYSDYWLVDENGKKRKNPNPEPNPYNPDGIWSNRKSYKIITGFDYEQSVNNRLTKEGKTPNFQSTENWFNVLSKGLVTDKSTGEKFYFRYQYLTDSILEHEYLFQGNPIEKVMFNRFEKDKGTPYQNQGLDDPCRFQVVNLENIEEISLDHNHYYKV